MSLELSEKQQAVLDHICWYIERYGISPTLDEIRKAIGVSSIQTVVQHLAAIERKGFIQRDRNAKRNIRIVGQKKNDALVSVPVFASVGCGIPSVLTERVFDEYVQVSNALVRRIVDKKDLVIIRAVGDSMQDAGVRDGDFVLVEKTDDVKTGDLVVTIIDDTALLKKLTITKNAIILDPVTQDKSYPRIIMSRDFQIFGKMIDIIRVAESEDFQIIPAQ
ncbi:MAG: transcriptional repressor LexA [Patescibacteria group bacterium]